MTGDPDLFKFIGCGPYGAFSPQAAASVPENNRHILNEGYVVIEHKQELVNQISMPFDFPSGLIEYPDGRIMAWDIGFELKPYQRDFLIALPWSDKPIFEPKRQASHKLTPLERHQQSQRDKRAMVKRSRQL